MDRYAKIEHVRSKIHERLSSSTTGVYNLELHDLFYEDAGIFLITVEEQKDIVRELEMVGEIHNLIWIDNKSFWFKLGPQKTLSSDFKKNKLIGFDKFSFDEKTSAILLSDTRQIDIPVATNQYYLCRYMFRQPYGEKVKEMNLLDIIESKSDRAIYDTVLAVNSRVEKELGLKLFTWSKNHLYFSDQIRELIDIINLDL